MWEPDLYLTPSKWFSGLIIGLHSVAALALFELPVEFFYLMPLLLVSALVNVMKHGMLQLDHSVRRIWLTPAGWCLRLQNQMEQGPFQLDSRSRLDSHYIRLSFKCPKRLNRHVIITPAMIGKDTYHRLQVFLRWSPEKNHAAKIPQW